MHVFWTINVIYLVIIAVLVFGLAELLKSSIDKVYDYIELSLFWYLLDLFLFFVSFALFAWSLYRVVVSL